MIRRRICMFMAMTGLLAVSFGGGVPQAVVHAAATQVSGHVTTNTEWTLTGSPYEMTKTVTVDPGVTLTIDPGVVVYADAGVALQIAGKLIADGNPSQQITFQFNPGGTKPTTNIACSGTSSIYSWCGLQFSSGADAASSVNYATVMDAEVGMLDYPAASVSKDTFQNDDYGLLYDNVISGLALSSKDNNFTTDTYGISCAGSCSSITVNDDLYTVTQYGIYSGSGTVSVTAATSLSASSSSSTQVYGIEASGAVSVSGTAKVSASSSGANAYGIQAGSDVSVSGTSSVSASSPNFNAYAIETSGSGSVTVSGSQVSASASGYAYGVRAAGNATVSSNSTVTASSTTSFSANGVQAGGAVDVSNSTVSASSTSSTTQYSTNAIDAGGAATVSGTAVSATASSSVACGICAGSGGSVSGTTIKSDGAGVITPGNLTLTDVPVNSKGVAISAGMSGSVSQPVNNLTATDVTIHHATTGIVATGTVTIKGSHITDNQVGLLLDVQSNGMHINYNDIYGNSTYNVETTGNASYSVDATNNWWGTTDPVAIGATIYDCNQDTTQTRPCVNYTPFLTASIDCSASATPTPTPVVTATATETPLNCTPSPTNTPTPTPTATNTPTATPTSTPTSAATNTPTSTPTNTPVSTAIFISPSGFAAGSVSFITVSGVSFQPGELVSLSYTAARQGGGTEQEQAQAVAGNDGTFQATLRVPFDIVPASYVVVAHGPRSGTVEAQFNVSPENSTDTPTPTDTATPTSTPTSTPTATPTPVVATISVLPSTQQAGAPSGVTVTGSGFAAGETVRVSYNGYLTSGGSQTISATTTSSQAGTFTVNNLAVPANLVTGSYGVTATGVTSGTSATAILTVQPASSTSPSQSQPATIAVGPTSQMAGAQETLTVSGTGFAAVEAVSLSYTANLVGGGQVKETASAVATGGTFLGASLSVPVNVLPGSYQVLAVGASSGKSATAQFTVTAPPVATPTPTETPTATPLPAATFTPTPNPLAIIVLKVEILHKVAGKQVNTQTLRLGENATFVVFYHDTHVRGYHPAVQLILTSSGKTVGTYAMKYLKIGGHVAFEHVLKLTHRTKTDKFYAHFMLRYGPASAKRQRKFTLKQAARTRNSLARRMMQEASRAEIGA